jgi:hypothetical protein
MNLSHFDRLFTCISSTKYYRVLIPYLSGRQEITRLLKQIGQERICAQGR